MMQREQRRNRETREEPAAGGQEGSTHLSEMVSELVGLEKVGHSKQTKQCVKAQEGMRAKVFK